MMLRRLKEDVEKNLAPKEETIIEVGHLLSLLLGPLFISSSPLLVPPTNGASAEP